MDTIEPPSTVYRHRYNEEQETTTTTTTTITATDKNQTKRRITGSVSSFVISSRE
jgi:hypothetical protein